MTQKKNPQTEKEVENQPLESAVSPAEAAPVSAENQVAELEGRLAELEDRYLRLAAEFDNYRKRTAREYQNVIRGANDRILLEILELNDNFERALSISAEKEDGLRQGLELMAARLKELLKKEGLEELEVLNRPFDPETAEAILHVESSEAEGEVIEVLAKGYALTGRVLRPARVVVAKKPPQEETPCE